MAKKKQPIDPSVSSAAYQDVEREYKRKLAVVEWKPRMKTAVFWLWAGIDSVLMVIFFVTIFGYLIAGSFSEERLIARIGANVETFQAAQIGQAAEPLTYGEPQVLSLGGGFYDIVLTATNENAAWLAEFDYRFTTNEGMTGWGSAFVLPSSEAEIMRFREAFEGRPTGVELEVDNLVYTRIPAEASLDIATWIESRNALVASNITYQSIELDGGGVVAETAFTLTNETAYSYYNPSFQVILTRAGRNVAVNQVQVPSFESSESRNVSLRWLSAVPADAEVRVVPVINYFDEDEYMRPSVVTPGG
ncbi:MAG: hypothetical protein O3B96_02345, partial [bacterium]|nr:hypothetical protein [bacterium]